jgi:hypothetical protein
MICFIMGLDSIGSYALLCVRSHFFDRCLFQAPTIISSSTKTDLITYVAGGGRGKGIGGGREGKGGSSSKLHLGSSVVWRRIVVEVEREMERHVSEYLWSVVNRFGHFKDFLNLLAFVLWIPSLLCRV